MADIFGNVQPPEWLREIARPPEPDALAKVFVPLISGLAESQRLATQKNKQAEQTGGPKTSFWEQIPQGFHDSAMRLQDPLWDMHVQQSQLNLAEQKLKMDSAKNQMNQRAVDMADVAADQQTMATWLQENNTIEKRADKGPPPLKSDWGVKYYEQMSLADSRSMTAKTVVNDIKNFQAAVRNLNPEDRARILAMPGGQNGEPSQQQLDALRAAAEKVRAPVKGTLQELEAALDAAKAAGDTEKIADYRNRINKLTDEGYTEPTTIVKDGRVYLGYRKTLKEVSSMTPEQKLRHMDLDIALRAAASPADKAKAQADLDKFYSTLTPPPATVKTSSGKQFNIEPIQ